MKNVHIRRMAVLNTHLDGNTNLGRDSGQNDAAREPMERALCKGPGQPRLLEGKVCSRNGTLCI